MSDENRVVPINTIVLVYTNEVYYNRRTYKVSGSPFVMKVEHYVDKRWYDGSQEYLLSAGDFSFTYEITKGDEWKVPEEYDELDIISAQAEMKNVEKNLLGQIMGTLLKEKREKVEKDRAELLRLLSEYGTPDKWIPIEDITL